MQTINIILYQLVAATLWIGVVVSPPLRAQNIAKTCPRYEEQMRKGEDNFAKNNYYEALRNYQAATIAANECGMNSAQPDLKIQRLVAEIEKQRTAAQQATKQAKTEAQKAQQSKIEAQKALHAAQESKTEAQQALYAAQQSKIKADTSAAQAKRAQAETQTALQKAEKLINAFYFYDNKFALAFKDKNFYFINKSGDEVTKLGQWKKAEQFDDSGFAKIENYGCPKCLLDTLGNTYRVAYDIKDLNPNITALHLSKQQLTALPEQVCQNTQLKVLLLSRNKLSTLPESITKLSNLQSLDLGGNQLSTLPESITKLSNLQSLDLGGNQLSTLPESIGQLSNLQTLNLEYNKLSTLPQSIGQLSKLQTLDLSSNELSTLPQSIGQLSKLQTLDLSSNELSTLPESITKLSNCKKLYLNSNKLNTLPESIGQLSNLQELNLWYNLLSTLPESIGQLSNLQTLDLRENQLSTLPESIGQLSKLQELNLWYNLLSTLPESIGQLSNLQTLDLSGNSDLCPYYNQLEGDKLKTFLTKLSKGEVRFEGFSHKCSFNELLETTKQDSTNSSNWLNLSYYALFVNKPQLAIQAAQKALALDSTKVIAETNLALGYLLNNQYAQAEAIYLKWKDESFPNGRSCNDAFLEDIAALEAAGITHPDFERVRALLK